MLKDGATNRQAGTAECFRRGLNLATHKRNYDYAHIMFAQCVADDPSNLQYAEAMLKNLRDKFSARNKKSPGGFLHGGSRSVKKALQRNQWTDILRLGVDVLGSNPWDVATLRAMAEACAAQHYHEVELVYLKQALDAAPKDIEVNRHCARALGRMGQFDQSIACWHRVEKLKGKDEEAAKMISFLAEEKFRCSERGPSATRPATVPAKTETAAANEHASDSEKQRDQLPHELSLTPQQLLERAVATDPKDLANQLALADLLIASEFYESAQSALKRAILACGELPCLTHRLEKVRNLIAQQQAAAAAGRLAAERRDPKESFRMPWLELTLVAAVLGLALQLYPPAGAAALGLIDVREWPRWAWFVLNITIVLALAAMRYAAELLVFWEDTQHRRKRHATGGKL